MGKVMSVVSRKINRFNVENRAHRLLDKEKTSVAPKYPSNIADYQRVLEQEPEYVQSQSKKNSLLDDRLKQVYITSTDPMSQQQPLQSTNDQGADRALPLNRKTVEDFEYGFQQPDRVTRGRTTLKQAIQFISDNQSDPNTWTINKIAAEYKLKESIVEKILENFHAFEVYIPDTKSRQNLLIHEPQKKDMKQYKQIQGSTKFTEDFNKMEEQLASGKKKTDKKIKDTHGRY